MSIAEESNALIERWDS